MAQALNNGLLVDPHDQQAISDALLKLVSNKYLWSECRKNGLKYIHRFSWPEHCRNYLSHVEHCRNRHPTSSLDIMKVPEEPISDSLGDVDDISLRFSMDGDFKLNGELDASTRQRKLVEAISQMNSTKASSSVLYSPGRRQMLFVITVDSYDDNGGIKANLEDIIKNVMKAAGMTSDKGKIGFVLATGSSVQEVVEITKKYLINLEDFDAIVCNSGSEIYYPWRDMVVDADYEAHVEYKWPGESIRSVILRLACAEPATEDDITEYASACSTRCYAISVKQGVEVTLSEKEFLLIINLMHTYLLHIMKLLVLTSKCVDGRLEE